MNSENIDEIRIITNAKRRMEESANDREAGQPKDKRRKKTTNMSNVIPSKTILKKSERELDTIREQNDLFKITGYAYADKENVVHVYGDMRILKDNSPHSEPLELHMVNSDAVIHYDVPNRLTRVFNITGVDTGFNLDSTILLQLHVKSDDPCSGGLVVLEQATSLTFDFPIKEDFELDLECPRMTNVDFIQHKGVTQPFIHELNHDKSKRTYFFAKTDEKTIYDPIQYRMV